jgi:hypothetical protein
MPVGFLHTVHSLLSEIVAVFVEACRAPWHDLWEWLLRHSSTATPRTAQPLMAATGEGGRPQLGSRSERGEGAAASVTCDWCGLPGLSPSGYYHHQELVHAVSRDLAGVVCQVRLPGRACLVSQF